MKKYFPILKNRQIETKILKSILSSNEYEYVFPIIEMIKWKSMSNKTIDFIEEIELINPINEYFIDIVRAPSKSTYGSIIVEYLLDVSKKKNYAMLFMKIVNTKKGIPLISLSHDFYFSNDDLKKLFEHLEKKPKAIRLHLDYYHYFDFSILDSFSKRDYFFFDIGEQDINSSTLRVLYKTVTRYKRNTNVVILNSPRPEFPNLEIIDNEIIMKINNSAFEDFSARNFDGFGDYASSTGVMPTTGGAISPAAVFYHLKENVFYGFRGGRDLDQFNYHIIPSIMESSAWICLSTEHIDNCPGCKMILDIRNGVENGRSQGKWKGISMDHYIYSINEVIKKNKS